MAVTAKKKAVTKKKAAVKKPTTVKPSVRRVAETVTNSNETFSTSRADNIEVPNDSVLLFINGQSRGVQKHDGLSLVDFVTIRAERAGIRTFGVYVDGDKVTQSQGRSPLTNVGKVEIVAKDARGGTFGTNFPV